MCVCTTYRLGRPRGACCLRPRMHLHFARVLFGETSSLLCHLRKTWDGENVLFEIIFQSWCISVDRHQFVIFHMRALVFNQKSIWCMHLNERYSHVRATIVDSELKQLYYVDGLRHFLQREFQSGNDFFHLKINTKNRISQRTMACIFSNNSRSFTHTHAHTIERM